MKFILKTIRKVIKKTIVYKKKIGYDIYSNPIYQRFKVKEEQLFEPPSRIMTFYQFNPNNKFLKVIPNAKEWLEGICKIPNNRNIITIYPNGLFRFYITDYNFDEKPSDSTPLPNLVKENEEKTNLFQNEEMVSEKNKKKFIIVPHKVDKWRSIIKKNKYIVKTKSDKKKDPLSLSFLVGIPMSHSDAVKLGYAVEDIIRDMVIDLNSDIKNIKTHNSKGKKERDLLFENPVTKQIFYAEVKSNLNLDTEKKIATREKCLLIQQELSLEYPEHQIHSYLLNTRYLTIDDIPFRIKNKYSVIKQNICGINDYFKYLNVNMHFDSYDEYKEFLRDTFNEMVRDSTVDVNASAKVNTELPSQVFNKESNDIKYSNITTTKEDKPQIPLQ